MTPTARVAVDLLGPLRLWVGDETVEVPGPRRRAVLALLALAEGRAVSVDGFLDAVWPDEVPTTGRRALHAHISRLRGHLGPGAERLERQGSAYSLHLDDDGLDVGRARRLAAAGRRRSATDPNAARPLLDEAWSLWRGRALDEFPDVAPLAAEATGLEELRAEILDDLLEAGLAAGTPGVLQQALGATAADPRRERTHRLLMRALAAVGRASEALEVAHQFRRRLVEATGLDPSTALAELEQAIASGGIGSGGIETLRPAPSAAADGAPAPSSAGRSVAPDAAPLVGRSSELSRLEHLMAAPGLVTVLGPGGVGKTSLARAATDRLASDRDLVVVDLGAVTSSDDVMGAFATALHLSSAHRDDVVDRAADRLAVGDPVVLLDSCEHLLESCRVLVGALLPRCPRLSVVATSRERLGLGAERLLRMGPLPLPDPGEDRPEVLAANPAVQAFVAHASRSGAMTVDHDSAPVISEVVRRLDGLPLALELAAGRVATLGLVGLLESLGRSLDLLGRRDGDPRHQTLRRAVEWSYRLLGDDDRMLFRALGTFPGGVELTAVRHVAAALDLRDDPALLMARLADASMLAPDADLVARYTMLETIRALAREEQQSAGEQDRCDQILLDWASLVAATVDQGFDTREGASVDRLLRREMPNLRAARAIAIRRGSIDGMVDAVLHLHEAAHQRDLPELGAWTIDLAQSPLVDVHPRRAELLGAASVASWMRGDLAAAQRFAEAGLAEADESTARRSLDGLGAVHLFAGDPAEAERLWTEADRVSDEPHHHYLASAALCAGYNGDDDRADELLAQAFAQAIERESDAALAYCHYTRAEVASVDHPDEAREDYSTCIVLAQRVGATFVGSLASVGLVSLLARGGDAREALDGFRWLLRYFSRSGNWTQQWTTVRNLAALLARHGEPEVAALLLHCADQAAEGSAINEEQRPAYEALQAEIAAALGPEGRRRVDRQAMTTSRVAAVEAALEAIDRVLASL
ncbi:MAG: ATP-binding protein [Acidimicrobiales bacterium]